MKQKLCGGSLGILGVGLPIIAAELIYIAVSLSSMSGYDAVRSGLYIFTELEHVLMGLALLVGGSLLFDLAERGF